MFSDYTYVYLHPSLTSDDANDYFNCTYIIGRDNPTGHNTPPFGWAKQVKTNYPVSSSSTKSVSPTADDSAVLLKGS
jgi:hypothetical protein